MAEDIQALIEKLAQLQAMLVHAEVMLDVMKDHIKELRYEIRNVIK